MELHIPKKFSPERPALRFSHASLAINLNDHPQYARVPRPSPGSGPWAWEGGSRNVHEILEPTFPAGTPLTIEDYLHSDEPPFWLHVVTFRDATIVALQQPHAHLDATSVSAIVKNWCRVLAGDEEHVAPLAEHNPMNNIEDDAVDVEEWVLKDQLVTGFRFFLFVIVMIFRDIFLGQRMQRRLLILPSKTIAALRQRAEDDLDILPPASRRHDHKTEKPPKPFISDGDIMSAFLVKGLAHSLGTRALSFINVCDPRKRLPQLFDPSVANASMAILSIHTVLGADEARELSLGRVALRIRDDLVRQTTPPQLCAQGRQQRALLQASGQAGLIMSDVRNLLFFNTNWSLARFYEVADFGPAVMGMKTRGQGVRGKPSLFFGYTTTEKTSTGIVIYGKDGAGNYWMETSLPFTTWARIDEDLAKM